MCKPTWVGLHNINVLNQGKDHFKQGAHQGDLMEYYPSNPFITLLHLGVCLIYIQVCFLLLRHLKCTKLYQKQPNYAISPFFVLIWPAVTLRWPCHGLEVTPLRSTTPTHVPMCTSVGFLHMKLKYRPLV